VNYPRMLAVGVLVALLVYRVVQVGRIVRAFVSGFAPKRYG
jgi:hypothetical protein